jgi:6-phosphogluconolactonase
MTQPEPASPTGAASTAVAAARGEPEIIVGATPDDVSAIAAQRIVDGLNRAIAERGRAHFVTTGGSTPVGIYRVLSERLRGAVNWERVELWWGDDRFVPRDHPDSNVLAADSILLAVAQFAGQTSNLNYPTDVEEGTEPGIVMPVANVHPIPCGEAIARGEGPAWAARAYIDQIEAAGLHVERGFPVFDVILLGLGPDGHLMSVFPGSDAFDRSGWVLDIPAPTHVEPHVARVTMHPGVLGVARSTLMVTSGAAKADIVGQIFMTERNIRQLTAQIVRHMGATWILDQAAASELPEGLVP